VQYQSETETGQRRGGEHSRRRQRSCESRAVTGGLCLVRPKKQCPIPGTDSFNVHQTSASKAGVQRRGKSKPQAAELSPRPLCYGRAPKRFRLPRTHGLARCKMRSAIPGLIALNPRANWSTRQHPHWMDSGESRRVCPEQSLQNAV